MNKCYNQGRGGRDAFMMHRDVMMLMTTTMTMTMTMMRDIAVRPHASACCAIIICTPASRTGGQSVVRHASNINHYPSPIKHQTSNITHQTSNIKHQTSPIKHHTSPIKHHPSRVTHHRECLVVTDADDDVDDAAFNLATEVRFGGWGLGVGGWGLGVWGLGIEDGVEGGGG